MVLQAYFNFNRFPTDEFGFLEPFGLQNTHTVSGGTITIITFNTNIKYNLINPVMTGGPFLLGGIGVTSRSRAETIISALIPPTIQLSSERNTVVSLAIGGGADIPIGDDNYIFVELKYTIGLKDPTMTYLPIKIGFMW
mgnify:CR=1 FL=1